MNGIKICREQGWGKELLGRQWTLKEEEEEKKIWLSTNFPPGVRELIFQVLAISASHLRHRGNAETRLQKML
jgi:hypothetical protein